jgi:hypothetical protein
MPPLGALAGMLYPLALLGDVLPVMGLYAAWNVGGRGEALMEKYVESLGDKRLANARAEVAEAKAEVAKTKTEDKAKAEAEAAKAAEELKAARAEGEEAKGKNEAAEAASAAAEVVLAEGKSKLSEATRKTAAADAKVKKAKEAEVVKIEKREVALSQWYALTVEALRLSNPNGAPIQSYEALKANQKTQIDGGSDDELPPAAECTDEHFVPDLDKCTLEAFFEWAIKVNSNDTDDLLKGKREAWEKARLVRKAEFFKTPVGRALLTQKTATKRAKVAAVKAASEAVAAAVRVAEVAAATAVEAAKAAAAATVRENEEASDKAVRGAEEATERAAALVEASEARSAQIRADIVAQDADMEDLRASGEAAKAELEIKQADVARREAKLEAHEKRTLEARIAKRQEVVDVSAYALQEATKALAELEKRYSRKQAVREHQIDLCQRNIARNVKAINDPNDIRHQYELQYERKGLDSALEAALKHEEEESLVEAAKHDKVRARRGHIRSRLDAATALLKSSQEELAQLEAGEEARAAEAEAKRQAERLRADVARDINDKQAEAAQRNLLRAPAVGPHRKVEAPQGSDEAPPQPPAPRARASARWEGNPNMPDAPPRPNVSEGTRPGLTRERQLAYDQERARERAIADDKAAATKALTDATARSKLR